MVVTGKNESEISEAKEVSSKAAVVEAVEDNSDLAVLTKNDLLNGCFGCKEQYLT